MFKRILFAIILFQYGSIYAHQPDIEFKHLKVKDGLSRSWVTSIYQDKQGFMWFGTPDGLNKYDGYTMTTYYYNPKNKNSLNSSAITALYEDVNSNLWIGTDKGLNLYDRTNDRFIHRLQWPQGKIAYILGLEDGRLYISSSIIGLCIFDPKNDSIISFNHSENDQYSLSSYNINSILIDNNRNIWIGTDDGLVWLNPLDYKFTTFRKKNNDANSLSDNNIASLLEDNNGRIWVGTFNNGLNLLEYEPDHPERSRFTRFVHNPEVETSISLGAVRSLLEDQAGQLWIGTENGGLNLLDLNSFQEDNVVFHHYRSNPFDNNSLSNNSIHSLCEDRDGGIWIGTFGDGINYYHPKKDKFVHIKQELNNPNSLNNNMVNVLYEEGDLLWIGTEGGVNLYNKKDGSYRQFVFDPENNRTIGSNAVWSIYRDSHNNLWFGTWGGGLNLFDSKNGTFTRFKHDDRKSGSISSNNIFGVLEDRAGNLWIGTMGGGLDRFDYRTKTFESYHDSSLIFNHWIITIQEDSYGKIWISTIDSLYVFDQATGTCKHFKHDTSDSKSLSDNFAIIFFEDSQKNLWIGASNGLNVYNRTDNNFDCYTKEHGLPNNQIRGILEDARGNLWISTNKGLSQFIQGTKRPEKPIFINYDVGDGLQGNEFTQRSCWRGQDGRMYFGGNNGFNVFHPDSLKENTHVPPVVITNFLIFNKPVKIGEKESPLKSHINLTKEIILSYKHSVFSFEFAALNYLVPEKNQYAYKLEGFEKDWNYVGNKRMATYTNLNPGKYTFHVKASNNDGIWNEEGTSLKIIITPPFWKTIWFRFIIIALIILATYGIHLIRVRNIVAYGLELENKVAERTADLEGFAYIASHDLKEPLRGINQLAEWITEDYSDVLKGEGKRNLKLLRERTRLMNDMIQGILEYSSVGRTEEKTEKIDLNELVQDTIDLLAPPDNIKIIIENKPPKYTADKTRLTQIFENLIGNAIKYIDKPEGVIKIGCSEKENEWKFSVSDNGPGIDEKYFEKIFKIFQTLETKKTHENTGIGLAIVKRIIDLYKGRIWLESEMGKGTTFHFTLPKQRKGNYVK